MEERSSAAPTCKRGNDLMAFLYGEVDDREARDFEHHLRTCGQCKVELSLFRQIRESIVAWRQESLGFVPAQAVASNSETAVLRSLEPKKPSALAAIRGFFDLSPFWMKAAVSFASVLFCVVAVLGVARLFDKPTVVTGDKRYTETELKAIVEEAVANERRLNPKDEASPSSLPKPNDRPGTGRRVASRSSQTVWTKARQRPLTKLEREQLAADLRLISSKDETKLDLLGDRINQ